MSPWILAQNANRPLRYIMGVQLRTRSSVAWPINCDIANVARHDAGLQASFIRAVHEKWGRVVRETGATIN